MSANKNDRILLGSRLISSAASWAEVSKRTECANQLFPAPADKTGAALCCIELTVIELSLKAILAMEGYNEGYLKKKMSHKLSEVYGAIPDDIKAKIASVCGYDNDRIMSELRNIDKSNNGLINWRYLDFVDSLTAPSTKQHFCDTFVRGFMIASYQTARTVCRVDHGRVINIGNPMREE